MTECIENFELLTVEQQRKWLELFECKTVAAARRKLGMMKTTTHEFCRMCGKSIAKTEMHTHGAGRWGSAGYCLEDTEIMNE